MKTDLELQQDVMNELQWEPSIKAAEIGVSVADGGVTLSGYVDSFYKKGAAERAVARVFGVKAVTEDLKVTLPSSLKRSDEDIALAASSLLEWNVAVPNGLVNVQVQDGLIILSGEVEWRYQKDAAEEALRPLMGVILISNQIAIKPGVNQQDVKDKILTEKIEFAFQRNALLDARRITIEARSGKVILSGTVHSWVEKEEAERVVWAAPRVSQVENHIVINP